MIKLRLQKNKKRQSGFTILVAVVTAGVLLIVAMSIGGIALKEQVLSIANKESQTAFYAADTGMECALYWDQKKGAFAPDTVNGVETIPSATKTTLKCNGDDNIFPATVMPVPSGSTSYSFTFKISNLPVGDVGGIAKTCAVVTVYKDISDETKTTTTIKAYGYNTCDASLNRLERGIEARY